MTDPKHEPVAACLSADWLSKKLFAAEATIEALTAQLDALKAKVSELGELRLANLEQAGIIHDELCLVRREVHALKEENERLKRNRDMWKGQVDRQAAQLTAMRTVMKPFAAEAACYDPDEGDNDDSVWATPVNFKIRDLRAARAALTQPQLPEIGESVEGGECQECGGTGMRDTGGVHPWGEHISVPCDCKERP